MTRSHKIAERLPQTSLDNTGPASTEAPSTTRSTRGEAAAMRATGCVPHLDPTPPVAPQVTIIVPVYQEASLIRESVCSLYRELSSWSYDFEILVADDGSTDHSLETLRDLALSLKSLRCVRCPLHRGRGAALSEAIGASAASIICYIDADLQIDPVIIPQMVEAIEDGVDIAIGCKHHPHSALSYPAWRRFQSLCYNALARRALRLHYRDFQCGAKAFRRAAIMRLLPCLRSSGWSWDTELLFVASRHNLSIAELPVVVRSRIGRRSRVRPGAIGAMMWNLLRLCFTRLAGDRSARRVRRP